MDQEKKKKKTEISIENLWDACPNTCGCDEGCALDDQLFYESALLDDYKRKMRCASEQKRNEAKGKSEE